MKPFLMVLALALVSCKVRGQSPSATKKGITFVEKDGLCFAVYEVTRLEASAVSMVQIPCAAERAGAAAALPPPAAAPTEKPNEINSAAKAAERDRAIQAEHAP